MKMNGWGRCAIFLRKGSAIAVSLLIATGCAAGGADSSDVDKVQEQESTTLTVSAPSIEQSKNSEAAPQQADTADLQYFVDDAGLAIRGADPVAYFTEGAAVTGLEEFSHSWGNATWRFSSVENRDLFAANPEQYAPQYGGFCAWAVSQGYTASIDPEAWRIVDGRLYLNYSAGVQRQWEQDIPGNISKADANWPGVLEAS